MRLKHYFAGLSRNTYLLALASLFADVSAEMLYPILPVFLTQNLGATGTVVGIIDGVAQAVQDVAQGFSGWVSDRLRRRKGVALAGYALAAVAKPLIGLSTGWWGVLGARSLDRLGSGTRSRGTPSWPRPPTRPAGAGRSASKGSATTSGRSSARSSPSP